MVEYIEDTIGPSPLMEDQERRCWDLVVGSGDLVDARLCASMTKGPHFTRQAWYGERLDQSRLDRFYISERGEWIHHIKKRDAPTKFFFARLKAKLSQEEMSGVVDTQGRLVEEEGEVLQEVHKFYKELYTEEVETEECRTKREQILRLVDRGFTEEQNRRLEAEPDKELITEIVRDLPKEKSPGLDGVTAEILVLGWEFMQQDCFWMVGEVWRRKSLWGKDRKGVIKLIPKNKRKHLLQNWRPITLLTTTYKIIAKIFARRLKEMLPALIDEQQTGFVAGRNIIDNILSLRLAQEWAQVSDQNCIFIKLDFMKAYDRIAHGYLWDTLRAMGMGQDTLERIKGLVVGGSAVVHVNGLFTKEFELQRGVRQGCPLAPLLFAMFTQPLMRLLREEERRGNIHGMNIGGESTLLHQLFADDTGISITMEEQQFARLQEVIREYEQASGARLNVQKSTIMQLNPGPAPEWLADTGCEIARPDRPFVYLGVQTSSPVDERSITESIVQKMMKKLNHWSNKLLSWPAKTCVGSKSPISTHVSRTLS
ncbi:hypothetical protein R1sor_004583 [Riccia sorocarpa]|uniref:Reverse transcriptase domain-containing protein n=1 Tax=Riccia sorocarpa TaxID=122646 RepID=A0ABD3HHC4_9MARC